MAAKMTAKKTESSISLCRIIYLATIGYVYIYVSCPVLTVYPVSAHRCMSPSTCSSMHSCRSACSSQSAACIHAGLHAAACIHAGMHAAASLQRAFMPVCMQQHADIVRNNWAASIRIIACTETAHGSVTDTAAGCTSSTVDVFHHFDRVVVCSAVLPAHLASRERGEVINVEMIGDYRGWLLVIKWNNGW